MSSNNNILDAVVKTINIVNDALTPANTTVSAPVSSVPAINTTVVIPPPTPPIVSNTTPTTTEDHPEEEGSTETSPSLVSETANVVSDAVQNVTDIISSTGEAIANAVSNVIKTITIPHVANTPESDWAKEVNDKNNPDSPLFGDTR